MEKSDIPAVVDMEAACFSQPWDEAGIVGELDLNPFSTGWILEENARPVGYAFFWETFETAQLARIGILPGQRKKGLGKILLSHLEEHAKGAGCELVRLEVRPSNVSGNALYESLGYVELNRVKHYYPDGEDARILGKGL